MFHIHLGHFDLVLGVALDCIKDEFMLQLTLVRDVEADGFTLLDGHLFALDQHFAFVVFEQSDINCAVHIGGFTRHADHHGGRLGLTVPAIMCACGKCWCRKHQREACRQKKISHFIVL